MFTPNTHINQWLVTDHKSYVIGLFIFPRNSIKPLSFLFPPDFAHRARTCPEALNSMKTLKSVHLFNFRYRGLRNLLWLKSKVLMMDKCFIFPCSKSSTSEACNLPGYQDFVLMSNDSIKQIKHRKENNGCVIGVTKKSSAKLEVLCVSSIDAGFPTFLPLTSLLLFLCQTHMHTCFGDANLRCEGQRPEPGLLALSSCMAGIGLLKRWQKQNMAQTKTPEGARPSWNTQRKGDTETLCILKFHFLGMHVNLHCSY